MQQKWEVAKAVACVAMTLTLYGVSLVSAEHKAAVGSAK